MGLDGLSVSNLGLYRPTSPSEVAFQAERTAQQQAEIVIKQVNEAEKAELDITERDNDEKSNYEGREYEGNDDQQEALEDDVLKNNKKFKVKFNHMNDMVELIDTQTGKVIETIKPEDLISLISKTKDSSGILVDREI